MTTLVWVIAILASACLGYSNALLAIIAILLLEIGLTVGRAKEGIATLCDLLKDDDEPDVEQVIQQMDEAVKRMTVAPRVEAPRMTMTYNGAPVPAGGQTLDEHESEEPKPTVTASNSPQTVQMAPPDWFTVTKES